MALDFALEQGQRCILVLDALFSVAAVFQLVDSVWSVACQTPLVTILVRAKKNYVAYFPAQRPDLLKEPLRTSSATWCSKIFSMSRPVRRCKKFEIVFLRTKKLHQTAIRPLKKRLLKR
jgi:hypothetical protein